MKAWRRVLCCALLFSQLVVPPISSGQISPSNFASVWLRSYCPVGEEGRLEAELAQIGAAVESILISAAQNGPDSATLLNIQATAGSLYDTVLSANVEVAQAQTKEQYVAEAIQNATIAYQSRALVGLGIIGDNSAAQTLQAFASNSSSALSSVATHWLAGIFSGFSVDLETSSRGFELNGTFALRPNGNGVNPVTEPVVLQVGTYSGIILPNSFIAQKNGSFVFEGVINGVNLEVHVEALSSNSFSLSAEGNGIDLAALTNPVTVALSIGNYRGRTTVRAEH